MTCDTPGCHRDDVVTLSFGRPIGFDTDTYRDLAIPEGHEHVETDLCLQCRRAIEFARGIPFGDDSDEWHDAGALREWIEEKTHSETKSK